MKKDIYLIIDPAKPLSELLKKLASALQEKLYALQIWDNFVSEEQAKEIIPAIASMCRQKDVPVLINNRWNYLSKYDSLAGVHFDKIPPNWEYIRKSLPKNTLLGITANNDLRVVEWAEKEQFSYISFCSMFPSCTANSCELVQFETILKAKTISKMPIFLAGGISVDRLPKLQTIQKYFDGLALVSGIMSAENPLKAIQTYCKEIQTW